MELGSDQDVLPLHRHSPDVEEESRYTNRYLNKRRRIGTPKQNGTRSIPLFLEASEDELSSRGSRKRSVQHRGAVEARRAYWASKGMSGGGLEESD